MAHHAWRIRSFSYTARGSGLQYHSRVASVTADAKVVSCSVLIATLQATTHRLSCSRSRARTSRTR
eukprot:scaffold109065_cov75-Phaeocystis_antarctica.AAC.8